MIFLIFFVPLTEGDVPRPLSGIGTGGVRAHLKLFIKSKTSTTLLANKKGINFPKGPLWKNASAIYEKKCFGY